MRGLCFALVLLTACAKSVPAPALPSGPCDPPKVSHAAEVSTPDCQKLLGLIEAGRSRYAAKIDSRARAFDVQGIVRIFVLKPDGHHPDGRPYIQMGNETWAGYFNSQNSIIFLADINALDHEVVHALDRHFYPTLLRSQPGTPGAGADSAAMQYRWQIIEHGTADDPMRAAGQP